MADPYADKVVLLLHFEEMYGKGGVFDYSGRQGVLYAGPAYSRSSVQKKFGDYSGKFDSSVGSHITGPVSTDFALGVDDFTVEAWVFPTKSGGYSRIVQFGANWGTPDSVAFICAHEGVANAPSLFAYKLNNARAVLDGGAPLALNQWSHYAVTRTGGVLRLFVNGTLRATNSTAVGVSIDSSPSNFVCVGQVPSSTGAVEGFEGFIDELRITKASRYTADFIPDTTAFEPYGSPPSVGARRIASVVRNIGAQMSQRPWRAFAPKAGVWRWETQTTGSGTISGIVTIENIPGSRKVRLYRKHDGMLLREMWSAPSGAYSFTNLDPAWEYFVVAHDHLRIYNGVIQDMIQP